MAHVTHFGAWTEFTSFKDFRKEFRKFEKTQCVNFTKGSSESLTTEDTCAANCRKYKYKCICFECQLAGNPHAPTNK